MTTRTTADVLITISEDVADLASIAHALDGLTSELNLDGVDHNKIRDLQRVGALFQHLDDIAALLGNMSSMIGAGPDLDVKDLSDSVRFQELILAHTNGWSTITSWWILGKWQDKTKGSIGKYYTFC